MPILLPILAQPGGPPPAWCGQLFFAVVLVGGVAYGLFFVLRGAIRYLTESDQDKRRRQVQREWRQAVLDETGPTGEVGLNRYTDDRDFLESGLAYRDVEATNRFSDEQLVALLLDKYYTRQETRSNVELTGRDCQLTRHLTLEQLDELSLKRLLEYKDRRRAYLNPDLKDEDHQATSNLSYEQLETLVSMRCDEDWDSETGLTIEDIEATSHLSSEKLQTLLDMRQGDEDFPQSVLTWEHERDTSHLSDGQIEALVSKRCNDERLLSNPLAHKDRKALSHISISQLEALLHLRDNDYINSDEYNRLKVLDFLPQEALATMIRIRTQSVRSGTQETAMRRQWDEELVEKWGWDWFGQHSEHLDRVWRDYDSDV